MTQVMADGRALTKGELSTAVSPMVDPRLAPLCPGCGVHHVQDALFRTATLQAVSSPRSTRLVVPLRPGWPADRPTGTPRVPSWSAGSCTGVVRPVPPAGPVLARRRGPPGPGGTWLPTS